MNKNYLKRKELNSTFGLIEVYNPSPEIRKEMAKDIGEMNTKMIELVSNEIKKRHINKDEELNAEEFNEIFNVIKKDELTTDGLLKKYIIKLTNVPEELLDDEEILEDPSEDLRLAVNKINKFLSEFVDEYTELFNSNTSKAIRVGD